MGMDSTDLDNTRVAFRRQGLKFWGEMTNWRKLRLFIAWPMIAVFALGSFCLWWGAITGLETTGGFAGIASWQILGIGLLFYQAHRTYRRATERNTKGVLALPQKMRQRAWAIYTIIACNIIANGVVIVLILDNLRSGRLQWITQDTLAFAVALLIAVGVFVWKRRETLRSEAAMFGLALGTRVIPQTALVFSPDLHAIPWLVLIGLGAMAGQRLVVSSIEYIEAQSGHAQGKITSYNVSNARWIWRGDLGNALAALVPILARISL